LFKQRTLKKGFRLSGVGLHTGKPAAIVVSPAPTDTGIVFISQGVRIKAGHENVVDTSFATSLGKDGVVVRTVEHLLAAFAGMGVDNAFVEIDGPEVPVMDGSSDAFVRAIEDAGLARLDAPRRYIKVVKPITAHDGDKSASLIPSPVSRITYRIDFNHPMLAEQCHSLELGGDSFVRELSTTRTFGFLKDVEMLQKAGLALGGSLDNAVVLDDGRVLNEEGLRFPDEFVRHKMLDAIGDVSLAGLPVIGHLVADKSGHKLNHRLVTELFKNPDCWVVLEGEAGEAEEVPLTLTEAV